MPPLLPHSWGPETGLGPHDRALPAPKENTIVMEASSVKDLGSEFFHPGSRIQIRSKEFKSGIFYPKNCFQALGNMIRDVDFFIPDPGTRGGLGSRIRIRYTGRKSRIRRDTVPVPFFGNYSLFEAPPQPPTSSLPFFFGLRRHLCVYR